MGDQRKCNSIGGWLSQAGEGVWVTSAMPGQAWQAVRWLPPGGGTVP